MTTKNFDPSNMMGYINALPEDLQKAWNLGMKLPIPDFSSIEKIVVSGMGGSAIGGDLLASFCRQHCEVPIWVHRDYRLPVFAKGPSTLVICSSHSGNTDETLSAFHLAKEKGCSLLTLSTGGKLATEAALANVPSWIFEHDGQPRSAVGYSFGMLLALVQRLGLIDDMHDEVTSTVECLQKQRLSLGLDGKLENNFAKQLAQRLVGQQITIFAAGPLEVIARRWKTQINEIAKALAQFESLPEADHNTLAGTLFPQEVIQKSFAVFLRSEMDHPRNKLRLTATQEELMGSGMKTEEVWAKGSSFLTQMWTLLQIGDYVSYYLALLYQVDPTPIDALVRLKTKLSSIS